MLRYHMVVVTRDGALRRAIKRLTTAAGATADFAPDSGQLSPSRPVDLAIFDARAEEPDRRFYSLLPRTARILLIIPGDELVHRVPLLGDPRVTSLFCHDDRFDDDEFISSATKALRGEIFGLQKYFPWGVTTFTMAVKSYQEKGRAIEIMMSYAQMAGVRGPVRDRIQLVADELMMNALYHAPTDERGEELYRGKTQKELAQLPEVSPIQVQYGCSGRYFGLAVRDGFGSLMRQRALEYLARARGGARMEQKQSGAGLGLISVLSSVSKLVFNLARSHSTEVIALFDMELFARGRVGARSLHLFTARPTADSEVGGDTEETRRGDAGPRAPVGARPAAWLLAGLLGAGAAGAGTALYFHRTRPAGTTPPPPVAAPKPSPTLTVTTEPADAEIRINGQRVVSGVTVAVPPGATELEIAVRRKGFRPWTRTLPAAELDRSERIFVNLAER